MYSRPPAAVDEGVIVTAEGAAEGGTAPIHTLVADFCAVHHGVTGRAAALTRAVTAAITARTVCQITTAHRTVPMVAAEAGRAATLHVGGRGHVHHSGEEQATATIWWEGTGWTPGCKAGNRLALLLWIAETLEVVVLVHGLILGEASCLGEAAATELGPAEGMGW